MQKPRTEHLTPSTARMLAGTSELYRLSDHKSERISASAMHEQTELSTILCPVWNFCVKQSELLIKGTLAHPAGVVRAVEYQSASGQLRGQALGIAYQTSPYATFGMSSTHVL